MQNKVKRGNKTTSEQTTKGAKIQGIFLLEESSRKLFRHQYDCKDIDKRTDGEHSTCFYLG